MARALHFNIKSIFLEDSDVLKLSDMPFAVEISSTGRRIPIANRMEMERQMKAASAGLRQNLKRLTHASAVTCEFATVRSEALGAIIPHCPDQCIVAMSETFDRTDMIALAHLFERIDGLAGALLVGPAARRRPGPIVIVEEQGAENDALQRIAAHLAEQPHSGEIRTIVQNETAAANANRYAPALVIAHRGEALRPGQGALRSLVNQLEAPLLLLR